MTAGMANLCAAYSVGRIKLFGTAGLSRFCVLKLCTMATDLSVYTPRRLGRRDRCFYCGRTGPTTADHFYPRSKGGRLCVRACAQCQREKGDATPLEWVRLLTNFIKACGTDRKGCTRGEFIRTYCEGDCTELARRKRMLRATLTLWERMAEACL
jgi:hypothetical protein